MSEILNHATKLRRAGKMTEAYHFIRENTSELNDAPLWIHHPMFWQEVHSGSCVLRKRSQQDVLFLYELWQKPNFIEQFNCLARPLPKDPDKLRFILDAEYYSTIDLSKELHWIVSDSYGNKYGLLSLMDISLNHKKAEVLLGVLPDAPLGLAPTSMYMLFKFFFEILKFNKLYTYVAETNQHSLKGTLHLGFKAEGLLKSEIFNPISKKFVDLVRTGINRQEALDILQTPLARRLLSKKSKGH